MDEVLVHHDDITLRVEVTGDGPVVLCVSGWPELAQSWRHQVAHLSARGYRVAALDVRGYGGSSSPPEVERYTLRELAGDVAAVAPSCPTSRSCWSATTGGRRSCGTRPSATPMPFGRWPG